MDFITSTIFWIILFILFIVIELITPALICIWFAFGSLAAVIVSFFRVPFWIEVSVCLLTSAILLIFTRPILVKKLRLGKEKTNADALIGQTGIVEKTILPFDMGLVKINGQSWSAVEVDNKQVCLGQEVTVLRIEGVKLIVKSNNNKGDSN